MKLATVVKRMETARRTLGAYKSKNIHIENCGDFIKWRLEGEENSVKFPQVTYRPYQQGLRNKFFNDNYKRGFLVRPRRSGKEVESWNILIEAAIRTPGYYIMVYPKVNNGRKILWDGNIILPDGTILDFLKMIPKKLIAGKPNAVDMKIKLINGSTLQVLGADMDTDKLRGINPRGAIFPEFAFADPMVYRKLMPVFRQNDGFVILQTTFNGMNHAYQLYNRVKNLPNEWYTSLDSVVTLVDEAGNRYITDDMIEADRQDGMPEYLIQQEYFSVVSLNEESMYFAVAMKAMEDDGRLQDRPILQGHPVFAAYDIGHHDPTTLVLFQMKNYRDPYIIYYHEAPNVNVVDVVKKGLAFCAQNKLLLKMHFLPHDGDNKHGTSQTVLKDLTDLGELAICVGRPPNKLQAISNSRSMLYLTVISTSDDCKRLIECLSNYAKKYDKKKDMFLGEPQHNWTSHGVDAYQTMTIAINSKFIPINNYGIIEKELN